MWDFPGPGLEPVSPALAGGFLTTAPPGKSLASLLAFEQRAAGPRFQLHCKGLREEWVTKGRVLTVGVLMVMDLHLSHPTCSCERLSCQFLCAGDIKNLTVNSCPQFSPLLVWSFQHSQEMPAQFSGDSTDVRALQGRLLKWDTAKESSIPENWKSWASPLELTNWQRLILAAYSGRGETIGCSKLQDTGPSDQTTVKSRECLKIGIQSVYLMIVTATYSTEKKTDVNIES